MEGYHVMLPIPPTRFDNHFHQFREIFWSSEFWLYCSEWLSPVSIWGRGSNEGISEMGGSCSIGLEQINGLKANAKEYRGFSAQLKSMILLGIGGTSLSTTIVPFIGIIYNGQWFLKGFRSYREVKNEAYVLETYTLISISDGMVADWCNPSISFNGQLYAWDYQDGCELRVYNRGTVRGTNS